MKNRARPVFRHFPIRDHTYTFEKEAHLWRAVLDRALLDCFYVGKNKKRLKIKEATELWLHTEDFETVCDLADIPSHWVKYIFDKYREDPTWEPPYISTLL